jgi:hypothetical protein
LYDRFEDVPPSKYDSCYLISDRPNQTAKFILCLAHGIQLVSNAWIIECCEVSGYSCLKIKGGYTLVTLPHIVTPYGDSVDGTRDRVTYKKLVTR